MTISKRTLWESNTTRLVAVTGFRLHPRFPRGRGSSAFVKKPQRKIEAIILHHLAGSFPEGLDAVERLARFHTSNPKYNDEGKWIGGGYGWPGPAYQYLVPYYPEAVGGKLEVYQLWEPQWITWQAGKRWNSRSVGVGCGGTMISRHAPDHQGARDPDPTQFEAARSLITEYLVPTLGLSNDDVLPHAEATGKVRCPGDVLEAWAGYHLRGKEPGWLERDRRLWLPSDQRHAPIAKPPRPDRRSLETWADRQAALVELGFDVGEHGVDDVFGYDTRSAVRAFQDDRGIVVDGMWGRLTEAAMRAALAEAR